MRGGSLLFKCKPNLHANLHINPKKYVLSCSLRFSKKEEK